MSKKVSVEHKLVAQNRRAFHDYIINEKIEAGIILVGTEVKSLRLGRVSIKEAYAAEQEGDIYLLNANISEYTFGNRFNHEPLRPRKLLLKKRELNRLIGAITRKGMTLVPLSLYFNSKGIAKVELGLAQGKKQHDKRQASKDREWGREKARIMKTKDR